MSTPENNSGNNPGRPSGGMSAPDPFRLMEWFSRLRSGDPRAGDVSALGILLVVCGLIPLFTAPFLAEGTRMFVTLGIGAVLVVSGAILIIYATRMSQKRARHKWEKNGTRLALDGNNQCACIQSISVPHGTRNRDVWLGVWVKGRCYPHPLKVLRKGTLSGCHVGLGGDKDVGKRFRVSIYSMTREAAAPLEEYYEAADRSGKYIGMPSSDWPKGECDELFSFSCVRKSDDTVAQAQPA